VGGGHTPAHCTLSPRTHLKALRAAGAYAVGFGRRAAGSTTGSATRLAGGRPSDRPHRPVCPGLRRRIIVKDVGRVLVGRAGGRYAGESARRCVPTQLTSSALSAPVALVGWLVPCPAAPTSSRASSPEMEGSRGGSSVRAPALSSARGAPGADASARPAGSRRSSCASSSARSKPPAALGAAGDSSTCADAAASRSCVIDCVCPAAGEVAPDVEACVRSVVRCDLHKIVLRAGLPLTRPLTGGSRRCTVHDLFQFVSRRDSRFSLMLFLLSGVIIRERELLDATNDIS